MHTRDFWFNNKQEEQPKECRGAKEQEETHTGENREMNIECGATTQALELLFCMFHNKAEEMMM